MSENLHNIDKIFRDSIEGHEEIPSQQVWNAIDNDLDKNKIKLINRKYTRLKMIAFLLLLLLLCIIIYDFRIKHPEDKVTKENTNSIIKKRDVPENNPGTGQNTLSKNNDNNLSAKTIQTKNIRGENKIQPDDISVTDNSSTKTISAIPAAISKKNMTGVTNADKSKKEEKDLVVNRLLTDEKTNKQAIIIIPLSIVSTEK